MCTDNVCLYTYLKPRWTFQSSVVKPIRKMAQAYLLDTNYTRPPDLSNLSSIPSDDTQIIPEDESLKDTTSQSLSNTHSQIILEDSQIIPGLFHDYSLPVSQPLSQPPSLPDSETLSQIIPDSLSVSPEEEPAEVSQYNPEEETIPEHEFEIKTTIGMAGAMKGKTREKVSLIIENYIFRKRYTNKNGTSQALCLLLPKWMRMESTNCWTDLAPMTTAAGLMSLRLS